MTKTKIIMVTSLLAVCVAVFGLNYQAQIRHTDSNPTPQASRSSNQQENVKTASIAKPALPASLQQFQLRFQHLVEKPGTQIKVLEKLMKYLKSVHGNDWAQHMNFLLADLFPEQASEMQELFIAMMEYRSWLDAQQNAFKTMTPEARKALIWDQRKALFGDDLAMEIWQAEWRSHQVQTVLTELENNSDLTFQQQVQNYQNAVTDIFQEQSPSFMEHHRQEVMDQFLTVETVQDNLAKLPQADRLQTLAQFRRELGMDEAAIERWTELDKKRDARWQTGEIYMGTLAQLKETYPSDSYDEKIAQLQNSLFGEEASSIRNEEAQGFYRFKQKQVYGKN